MSLSKWPVSLLTNALYKIGKGQLPIGMIGLFHCPQIHRHDSGGNDQLQRGCKLTGAARGTGAYAANSRYVTPAYVAATQTVPSGSIQHTTAEAKSKSKSNRSTR